MKRLLVGGFIGLLVLVGLGAAGSKNTPITQTKSVTNVVQTKSASQPKAATTNQPATTTQTVTTTPATAQTPTASQSTTTTQATTPASTTPTHTPAPTNCPNGTYTNSSGNEVCSPYSAPSAPAGATALCVDGTYSFSRHRSGTCSHHGGVAQWLY